MSTANAGSPKDPGERQRRGFPLGLALIAGGVVLGLAILIGPRVAGIFLGIVAPPTPPVPLNSNQISYTSESYGIDRWRYQSDDDLCQLVSYYQSQADQCPVIPPECGGSNKPDPDYLAACYGDTEFSIFAMRWGFSIPYRSTGGQGLQFDVSRDVSWLGGLPPEPFDSPYRNR